MSPEYPPYTAHSLRKDIIHRPRPQVPRPPVQPPRPPRRRLRPRLPEAARAVVPPRPLQPRPDPPARCGHPRVRGRPPTAAVTAGGVSGALSGGRGRRLRVPSSVGPASGPTLPRRQESAAAAAAVRFVRGGDGGGGGGDCWPPGSGTGSTTSQLLEGVQPPDAAAAAAGRVGWESRARAAIAPRKAPKASSSCTRNGGHYVGRFAAGINGNSSQQFIPLHPIIPEDLQQQSDCLQSTGTVY